ncbi:hypothetical protein E6C27_scaffold82G00860 [Cucumis melo var. makuwa]|uniref:Uncharacterized protein n=2 Tax=Cucumis melo TaxID=3656 RepID=A0A5A7VH33_CUCMM|nr:hypothetical protein E6C27_scaffold82G00860 [Cucumis melo var. makuwa]
MGKAGMGKYVVGRCANLKRRRWRERAAVDGDKKWQSAVVSATEKFNLINSLSGLRWRWVGESLNHSWIVF